MINTQILLLYDVRMQKSGWEMLGQSELYSVTSLKCDKHPNFALIWHNNAKKNVGGKFWGKVNDILSHVKIGINTPKVGCNVKNQNADYFGATYHQLPKTPKKSVKMVSKSTYIV